MSSAKLSLNVQELNIALTVNYDSNFQYPQIIRYKVRPTFRLPKSSRPPSTGIEPIMIAPVAVWIRPGGTWVESINFKAHAVRGTIRMRDLLCRLCTVPYIAFETVFFHFHLYIFPNKSFLNLESESSRFHWGSFTTPSCFQCNGKVQNTCTSVQSENWLFQGLSVRTNYILNIVLDICLV